MKFRGFFELMLGSKVKARLLEYLLNNDGMLSEREVAKRLGVSHVAVNQSLKALSDANLVIPSRVGGSNVWFLNSDSYAFEACDLKWAAMNPPLVDLLRKLAGEFGGLNQAARVALYGSVARGDEEAGSDIDLGVIAANQTAAGELSLKLEGLNTYCLKRYGNKLSARVLHYGQPEWESGWQSWLAGGTIIKTDQK